MGKDVVLQIKGKVHSGSYAVECEELLFEFDRQ